MLKLAKNLSSVGLLFTIQHVGVDAVRTNAALSTEAQVDADLSSLAQSVQKALALSGLTSEAEADNEIKNLIESHVQNQLEEDIENEETQKTNLEESVEEDQKQKVSTN